MTLDILRLGLPKDLLRSMTKEERSLFLALGHASNQVNALWKLVIILTNGDTEDPVRQRLEGAQTQVFVRLTIGAMWEAWRLVEDRFLKRPIGREYLPLLDGSAAEALDRLKKRFGKGSGWLRCGDLQTSPGRRTDDDRSCAGRRRSRHRRDQVSVLRGDARAEKCLSM